MVQPLLNLIEMVRDNMPPVCRHEIYLRITPLVSLTEMMKVTVHVIHHLFDPFPLVRLTEIMKGI